MLRRSVRAALTFSPVLIASCDGSHPKCTDDLPPGNDFLPLPVLRSSCGGSHPNCTDDLPPGSFVTLVEVVFLPSMKTFWFSFIPYDMVVKSYNKGGRKGDMGAQGEVVSREVSK